MDFNSGGTNFDAKLRRQSLDPEDLLAAHVGAMDICARGLKAAVSMIEDGGLEQACSERYIGWSSNEAKNMLEGGSTLEELATLVEAKNLNPQPKSGRQEILENYINRFV